jgi:lipid-binding SYLF domain-containing protein
MNALYEEVTAAMKRIEAKDQELRKELREAVGYAVFPSVGRAGLILGGAYGSGVVFEKGQPIGEASLGQLTIGIQVGGQTFSLVIIFRTKDAFDRFKHGRIAFTANASAAMVKAAASGTADYEKDVIAKAYSQGGMIIEASLGGQGFRFKPKSLLEEDATSEPVQPETEKKKVS